MKTQPQKILVLLSLVLPLAANAANVTWDANTAVTGAQDGSGVWDTNSLNWWTGAANAAFVNGVPDVPTFGNANGVAGTVTLGTNITSGNIIFNAPSVGNYTIAGGGYQLALTNRTITANVNATISADIYGFYAFSGAATLGNSGANAPAVLILSGNNSFTNFNLGSNAGNTTAAVRVNSSTAFGVASGTISIAGGQGNQSSHRIELTGSGMTISNSIPTQLGRNNYSAVIVNLGSGNTWAGRLTRSTGGQDCHITSEVANGITFSGATGGGIALASQAGAPRNYVLRGTGGGTISGVISNGSGANNCGIVKAGSGTWTLSGANTFTNGAIVNEGTLTLDYSAQDNSKLPNQGPLTLGGGTVNLSGGTHTEVVFSTTIGAGNSAVTRSSGTGTVRLNALTRNRGGVVDFGAASIADTDTLNVNGILGGYATVAGADWAMNSTGAGDGPITAYTGYTDIAATGSTIADDTTSNVRLNSAGGGGNIALGAATTTVNALLQNTSTAATVNTAGGILRLGATGGVLVPAAAQSLTIGTAADAGALTAGGADNTSGEIILINNSANAVTVNSTIADNGTGITSLTKAGSGAATLAGNNTHTGTNVIAGGTLNISSDANLGTAPGVATPGTILINGGVLNATEDITLDANRGIALGPTSRYGNGTINVASGKTVTYAGIVANADTTGNGPGASLTKTGPGTLVLSGANTYTSGTIINGGTLSITAETSLGVFFQPPGCYMLDNIVLNGGTLDIQGSFTASGFRGVQLGPIGGSGTGTISIGDGQTVTMSSRFTDNWNGTGSFTKTGNGTLILSGGVNDYSGDTTVSAGVLQINNSRSIPNGAGKGNVTVNGTMNINGVNVAINGLSGTGTVDNTTATAIALTVQSGVFAGTIQNSGGGPLALVCNGALTLTGTSTYTGSTLINGLLALQNGTTLTATTNIVVGSGAALYVNTIGGPGTGTNILNSGQTLSGSGTIIGSISGGGGTAISPGSSAGTLTINAFPLAQGSLTLSGGGALNYELANVTTTGGGVNDYLVVNGTLNVAGPTTLNLTYLNGLPASSGKYTLIQYGSFLGNVNDISVPAGFTVTNNTVSKTIEILVNHIPAAITWRGDGGGNAWDINITPNWIQSGTNQFFFNGDTANFDDSGSNNTPINISTPVTPAAVNVNASQNYTFAGTAIGSSAFSKSGSGTLTLDNDNTFASGGSINGGTVQIGNAGTTGFLGGGNLTNNGALVFNRDSFAVTNAISGSGSVSQIGSGSTALTASNSYAGLTLIATGAVQVANGASLGTTAAGTVVSNAAQLYITLNVNVADEALTLSGEGVAADGALRKGGGGASTYGGALTLLGDAMLKLDGNTTLNLTNAAGINGAGANANLVLAGDGGSAGNVAGPILLGTGGLTNNGGTWTVATSNNYAGNTVINGGALRIGSPLSLGITPTFFIADRILLNGGALEITNNTSVALDDGKIGITVAANSVLNVDPGATLTISNEITGGLNLTKLGAGTLVLNGSNSFTGVLNVDGNSTFANDGITRITTSAAVANIPVTPGSATIFQNNNNGGFSTLQLDGSAGSVVIPQDVQMSCRNTANLNLQNLAGSNVFAGGIRIQVGGADQWWQSDSGTLAFAGNIDYSGTLTGGRIYHFQGAGDHVVTGSINASPIGSPISVTKAGPGTLTLAGANTYGTETSITNGTLLLTGSISHTGAVTVVGGTLAGTGTISADAGVNVLPGGTLSPGTSIGTLTLNNNNLTLAGTTSIEVNKTAGTQDQVTGVSALVYGGTLVATNISGTPVIGDNFPIFTATTTGGNFANIFGTPGPGLKWTFNPATGVMSVAQGVPATRTNINFSVSGNTLTLSWPANYLGVTLQMQTNSLNVGIQTNENAWVNVPGTYLVTTTNITINPATPTAFFRLRHP